TSFLLFDAPPATIYGITWLICLFGLVGNRIVLWFLGFHIKRNPFAVYILNLAISDTFFLLYSTARGGSMPQHAKRMLGAPCCGGCSASCQVGGRQGAFVR
uniref:G-protein coupled receptors family 1 profile domain-containing protein n=1 Tax=Gopherus agassizii TaxID=38772 RepID=A0A452GUA8_9SAUR